MEILDRIEDQIAATGLPLFAITLAAVPCPDTPVILTLHWHGFIKEKLAEIEEAEVVSYTPMPSSALQLNERWQDLVAVDRAAMDAAWELGAWDVQRAERPGCMRPGAESTEALECLQASARSRSASAAIKRSWPMRRMPTNWSKLAARRGYLMWMFRPVCGGIWGEYADDATLVRGRAPAIRPARCGRYRQPAKATARRSTFRRAARISALVQS